MSLPSTYFKFFKKFKISAGCSWTRMLPKINRIKKKKDFEAVFKGRPGRYPRVPQSFRNNLFILRIAKNDLGLNRFGFVVSLKVSKKAVVRNKIRRRLAEIMRAEMKNIKTGTDVVVVALPGIEKKEFSEIKEAINNTFKCLNL